MVPGHPVDTFRRENQALGAAVAGFRQALATAAADTNGQPAGPDVANGLRAHPRGAAFVAPSGSLTAAQLQGLLGVLPVEVTFVDADDRVRYSSEGAGRIFERSRAILGRHAPPGRFRPVEFGGS